MLDFSIIIPVYNAEKTLDRCLESILLQNFSNYEVILIDDGSLDHSLNICKKYELLDKRYRVIHQTNRGASVARNVGLTIAQGQWICFIDSDDTIVSTYLQEIFNMVYNSEMDVVFIGYDKVYKNGKKESFVPNLECNSRIPMLMELSDKDMFGYTWIKSFRREVIKKVRFNPELNLFEDEVFTCQVLKNCEKIGDRKSVV